jgi:polysaccharide biosynthesis protein PslG
LAKYTRPGRRTLLGGVVALAAIGLVAALWLRPPDDPFAAGDVAADKPFPSLTYGIQTFVWWDQGNAGLYLDWVRLMSFSHVKQMFAWEDLEPERGVWDFSQADRIVDEVARRDLQLVARLGRTPAWAIAQDQDADADIHDTPPADNADFAAYCGALAARYAGQIAAYQVWNEPNLSREWGGQEPSAEAYLALLRACSDAIHAADPDAIVISAGLAPTGTHDASAHRDDLFLQELYDAGFAGVADVVGAHAPGFAPPAYGPDDAEADGQGRWATFRRIEDLRKIMVRNGDAARQMAILEFGYTTDPVNPAYAWFALDEETQASALLEAYDYAVAHWRPWVGLMSLIYLPDDSWTRQDETYWWAISTADQGHRPAFYALANMSKTCDDYVIPARDPNSPEALGLAPTDLCP